MTINLHTSTAIRGAHALQQAWDCAYPSDADDAALHALSIAVNFYPNKLQALYAWADALTRRIEAQLDDRHDVGARDLQSDLQDELATDDLMLCDIVGGLAGLIKSHRGNYVTPEAASKREDVDLDDVFRTARVVALKTA